MVHDVNPFGYLDIYISIAISDDDAADTTITWRMKPAQNYSGRAIGRWQGIQPARVIF